MNSARWRQLAFAGLIVAYFLFFTWDSLHVRFAPDDMANIAAVWRIPMWRQWLSPFMPWSTDYRPVAGWFYLGLLHFFNLNPVPYHVVILVFLLAGAFLVQRLAKLLGAGEAAALMAALIVCYHAGMSNLTYAIDFVYDVLCGFFYLAALVCYVSIRQKGRVPGWGATIGILALFLAALQSKEMAATLPGVLLLYEWLYAKQYPLADVRGLGMGMGASDRRDPSLPQRNASPSPYESTGIPSTDTLPSRDVIPRTKASDPGHAPSDPSRAATDPNRAAFDPNRAASDPNRAASDPSHTASDPSHTASDPSRAAFDPSHAATDPSCAAFDPSRAPSDPSRAASDPSHAASDPSRAATDPSRAATDPSHAATDPNCAASDPSRAATDPSRAATYPSRDRKGADLLANARTALWCALVLLPYLYSRLWRHDSLVTQGGYRMVISWPHFWDFQTRYLGDLFQKWPFFARVGVSVIWLLMAWLAWRRPRPVLRFCWFFLFLTPLPIMFLVGRAGACLYIPLMGWAIFMAVIVTDLAGALAGFLSGEAGLRRLGRPALYAILVAGAAFLWADRNYDLKWRYVESSMADLGGLTANIIRQFESLDLHPAPGSKVVFLDDPFVDWDMAHISELLIRDRSVLVYLNRKTPLTPELISSAEIVIDYRDGHLVRVR